MEGSRSTYQQTAPCCNCPTVRSIAAVRLHTPEVHTGLVWIDPEKGTLSECLALPSGGDTSYAGLVWHEQQLWVSYYASHEGQTCIYLAQVEVPPPVAVTPAAETPPYPRTNLATHYVVDPDWPHKPTTFTWAAMPGIAVDSDDQIWTFNRSKPPIQVYRRDGSFVHWWWRRAPSV